MSQEEEDQREFELEKMRIEKGPQPVPVSNIIAGIFSFMGFMIFVTTLLYFAHINGCLAHHP